MDSSSKATAAGKQRMVARLTTCSSSPACSVRAPWVGGGGRVLSQCPHSLGKGSPWGRAAGPGHSPSQESYTQRDTQAP